MKRRRFFIGAFLIMAFAFIGMGYAVLTQTLTIGGNVSGTKNDANLKVEFISNTKKLTDASGVEATSFTATASQGGTSATIEVAGMNQIGHTATFYFLVQNNSVATDNLDAVLSETFNIVVANGGVSVTDQDSVDNQFTGDHFLVTVSYETTNGTTPATGTISAGVPTLLAPIADPATAGQTIYVKVVVKLIDVIVEDTFPTHTLTITFNATTIS